MCRGFFVGACCAVQRDSDQAGIVQHLLQGHQIRDPHHLIGNACGAQLEWRQLDIGRSQVDLNNPIKTIGIHQVNLALHPDVVVTIEFNVARSADEAERQSKGEDLTSADAIYGVDEDEAAAAAEAAANDPDFEEDDAENAEGEEQA